MARTNRGLTIAFTLLLVAVLVSACEQPYSTPPAVTNTPIDPNSFFTTPIPSQPENMGDVENITTQTAIAGGATQTLAIGNTTPVVGVTTTPTPIINLVPTATQAVIAGPSASPVPPVTNSFDYTLKRDEFPFCIARRNGVNPYDLLKASGLTSPDVYYEGLALKIPQGSIWDEATLGPRALRTDHSYTVTGNGDTSVYGVACKYGSADPNAIASANGISVNANLTIGQTLSIP